MEIITLLPYHILVKLLFLLIFIRNKQRKNPPKRNKLRAPFRKNLAAGDRLFTQLNGFPALLIITANVAALFFLFVACAMLLGDVDGLFSKPNSFIAR